MLCVVFFFNDTATTEIYTLSLHDALPIFGTLVGLILAELHVIWRHQFAPNYRTPKPIKILCRWLCITTPERHQLHHRNANLAYGDVFTFYGKPAHHWLLFLRQLKGQWV